MISLRTELAEMSALVNSQHSKGLMALVNFDKDLAREIMLLDQRVNSSQVLLEKRCEAYISAQRDQTINLPFVLLTLRISRQVGIIGNIAAHIAKEILSISDRPNPDLLHQSKVVELYKIVLQMLGLTLGTFTSEVTSTDQLNYFSKDFQDTGSGTRQRLVAYINDNQQESDTAIHLFSINTFLENVVSHVELLQAQYIQKATHPNWVEPELRTTLKIANAG